MCFGCLAGCDGSRSIGETFRGYPRGCYARCRPDGAKGSVGGVVHRGFARKLAPPLPIRFTLLMELLGTSLVAICLALLMELLGTSLVAIRFTLLTELRHCKVDEGDEVDEGGTSVDEGECVKKGCEDFVV